MSVPVSAEEGGMGTGGQPGADLHVAKVALVAARRNRRIGDRAEGHASGDGARAWGGAETLQRCLDHRQRLSTSLSTNRSCPAMLTPTLRLASCLVPAGG